MRLKTMKVPGGDGEAPEPPRGAEQNGSRGIPGARLLQGAMLASGAIAGGLFWMAGRWPGAFMQAYSDVAYPALARVLGPIGRLVPLPLGELLLFLILGLVLLFLVRAGAVLARDGRAGAALLWRGIRWAAASASFLYAGFILAWGLNYRRPPLAQRLGWPVEAPRVEELRGLCGELVPQVNALRAEATPDPDLGRVAARASEGYRRLGPALHPAVPVMRTSPVKPALLSRLMSRALTWGMVIPWTHEALVSRETPIPAVPFTICHEMAHQRGVAREDEANFVGYVAARAHPDPDFRYSAQRFALHELLRQLARTDPAAARQFLERLDPAVREDDRREAEWFRSRISAFSRAQGRVYDGYLKSQGQREGIRSYGRVVDLLLAEARLRAAGRLPEGLACSGPRK